MVDVAFTALRPWCLLPDKPRVDRAGARGERDLYREQFRHLRITRLPEDCPPWVMGQELGWTVRSPVSLTMTPVDDVDLAVPPEETAQSVSHRAGRNEMWKRGADWIATTSRWLRLHDYRTDGDAEGGWEAMFLPNGRGTVEWRLGFAAHLPQPYFLAVLPPDPAPAALQVPVGVIGAKTVNAMAANGGLSIAIRPTAAVHVTRHQPVARLVLLHPDTLRATATFHPAP